MLGRLSTAREFPLPEVLVREPETWLAGRNGITAAVVHHTMMGYHGVGPGLMPSERQRLTDWAAQALEPEFQRANDMLRSKASATPQRTLRAKVPVPKKDAAEEQITAAITRNAEIDAENAQRRRAHLAEALAGQVLSCHLLYQTDAVRDQLIRAAEDSLDLHARRTTTGPVTWAWQAPNPCP